jgi:hypothetical protein
LSSRARAFYLVALKNLLHVLQLAFCAIHSLIEKDQKVCFRKVWQVCSSIVNLCTFLCLLMAQIYWQKYISGVATLALRVNGGDKKGRALLSKNIQAHLKNISQNFN